MFKYYQKFLVILFLCHSIATIAMQNSKSSSLLHAIAQENIKAIQQLCSLGVSLFDIDNNGNTVFHRLANENDEDICLVKERPENIIATIIKHACFINKQESIKQSIKTALLVFNRINNEQFKNYSQSSSLAIPQEIQLYILSKSLSIHNFHKDLYKYLLATKDRYQQLPLALTNSHVDYITQILDIKNKVGKTALDLLPKEELYSGRKTELKLLLEGTTLQEDLNILNKAYPNIESIPKNNLAVQIFNNYYNPTFTPSISIGQIVVIKKLKRKLTNQNSIHKAKKEKNNG